MKKVLSFTGVFIVITLLVLALISLGVLIWIEKGLDTDPPLKAAEKAQNLRQAPTSNKVTESPKITLDYRISAAAERFFIERGISLKHIISTELDVEVAKLKEKNGDKSFEKVGETITIPLGRKRTFCNKCASFYGKKFHKKSTSSGETFEMLATNTVASKFLPLGTTLKITNLKTDITRKAKVNDRGPYISKCKIDGETMPRTLDLSWGLAAALWMSDEEVKKAKSLGLIAKNQIQQVNLDRVNNFDQEVKNVAEKGLRKALEQGIMKVSYKILSFPDTSHT